MCHQTVKRLMLPRQGPCLTFQFSASGWGNLTRCYQAVTNLLPIFSSPPLSTSATISAVFSFASSTARVTSTKSQPWVSLLLSDKGKQWLDLGLMKTKIICALANCLYKSNAPWRLHVCKNLLHSNHCHIGQEGHEQARYWLPGFAANDRILTFWFAKKI